MMVDHSYDTLMVDEQGGVARITLNRPDKLNAFAEDMYHDLDRAITAIEANPAFRVLVITGAGRAFCAGGDVAELAEAGKTVESTRKRLFMSHGFVARVKRIKQPIIAAINGDAIGAGCSLALVCDLRIASEKARFGLTFSRVGLAPDMGITYNLVHAVGINKAIELSFLADIIDAKEAGRIGLVNRVVPQEELEPTVNDWATRLARAPVVALQLMKSALYNALNVDFLSALNGEINAQTICFSSEDSKEGMRAFLEKRKPVFGRDST